MCSKCYRLARNDVLHEDLSVIEIFVILMYDSTSSGEDINECRRELFTKKAKVVESITPTKDALIQHAERTMLQSMYVLVKSITLRITRIIDPSIFLHYFAFIK